MADDSAPGPGRVIAQAFPSVGIGLLVGLLVGMSVSPVVAGVLTSLGGLLAGLLGLQPSGEPDSEAGAWSRLRVSGVRIGAFGFACVAGVLLGLYIRTNDVFAVPVERQIATWTDAGYSKEDAKQFVAYQKLGLKPEGREVAQTDLSKAQASVLYSAFGDVDVCGKISGEQFGNEPAQVIAAYGRLSIGAASDPHTPLYQKLTQLAGTVGSLPADMQRPMLHRIEEVLCEIQKQDAATTQARRE